MFCLPGFAWAKISCFKIFKRVAETPNPATFARNYLRDKKVIFKTYCRRRKNLAVLVVTTICGLV